MRLGLQLYSVREALKQDFEGTIRAVASTGFEGVELFGSLVMPAPQLRTLLDENGLLAAGWHVRLEDLQGDNFAQTVAAAQILGVKHLVVAILSEQQRENGWMHAAGQFQQAGDALKPYGIKAGYHNHQMDFDPPQDSPWETVFANTDDTVIMQLDTGNAVRAGADILAVMKAFPGRAETVHLKPWSKKDGYECIIGQDDVPWQEFLQLCENTGGTQWLILEVESQSIQPIQSAVEQNVAAIKGLLESLPQE